MLREPGASQADQTRPTGPPSEPRSTQVASTVAPTGFFDRPSRPKSARRGFVDRFCRPKWLEEGSEERFWSILARFWVLRRSNVVFFQCFFARAGRPMRRRGDIVKTCKNILFLHIFCMSELARTTRNSIENHSERASRQSRATHRLRKLLFHSSEPQNGVPRGLWGVSGRS